MAARGGAGPGAAGAGGGVGPWTSAEVVQRESWGGGCGDGRGPAPPRDRRVRAGRGPGCGRRRDAGVAGALCGAAASGGSADPVEWADAGAAGRRGCRGGTSGGCECGLSSPPPPTLLPSGPSLHPRRAPPLRPPAIGADAASSSNAGRAGWCEPAPGRVRRLCSAPWCRLVGRCYWSDEKRSDAGRDVGVAPDAYAVAEFVVGADRRAVADDRAGEDRAGADVGAGADQGVR